MTARAKHRMLIPAFVLAHVSIAVTSAAAIIRVPADVATIQQGIDAAVAGDTVLVSPGTYHERIDFRGKPITVASDQGPDVTVIDGQRGGIVVLFQSHEGRDSVLTGFTITGGQFLYGGGGVAISGSSPTVIGNTITKNSGCEGVGVEIGGGAPRIERNKIVGNSIDLCTGGWGIGIFVLGNNGVAPAEIVGNTISDNTSIGATFGGGIGLFGAGNVVIQGNVIARNNAGGSGACGWGGALSSANFVQATIVDNLIADNVACIGGAAYWQNTGTSIWVNNTIAGNAAAIKSPGLDISGFTFNRLYNNIISSDAAPALFCEFTPAQGQTLTGNDVYSSGGAAYGGTCADQTGLTGNTSLDPRFVDHSHGDYRLAMTSPAIDSGDDAAPQLPATDLAGTARIVDGDGDGAAHVDMGAFEYHNHAPTVSAGADQTVALSGACTAAVTLSATGSDPDGDPLTYTWTSTRGMQTGQTLSLALPPGTYTFTVTADDGNGGTASDTVVVSVVDTTPPVIATVTATPSVLSSVDHKMVAVVVSVSAADQCGNAVSCRIVDVTSNEPQDGLGDGDTSPDWEITGPLTLHLRAERSGSGSGRVYTITVKCTDPSGNESTSTVTVTVPR